MDLGFQIRVVQGSTEFEWICLSIHTSFHVVSTVSSLGLTLGQHITECLPYAERCSKNSIIYEHV